MTPLVELSDAPLDLERLIAAVRSDACGAVAAFLGVVRERSDDDRAVDGLSYEVYEEMALPEMRAIAGEAAAKFGEARVALVHRTGSLRLGETSVAIAVAAAHRGVAFDACEYVIDELKRRVPIWKKEHYTDGHTEWRANRGEPRESAAGGSGDIVPRFK
jgi:molybdopterin synthase catalytic subunit